MIAPHQVSGGRISMRHTPFAPTIAIAILLAASASAQHTLAAKFDLKKPLTLKGTVTQIDWANPYVHIVMKVPDSPRPVIWAIEVEGAILLSKNGWSQASLPIGETITVQGFAARDGSKQVSGNSVVMASTRKSVYAGTNGKPPARAVASGPVPRWPNGQPRLGPPPG